ncbi:hypothetical protein LG943_16905 [Streptomonospora sp. S1-112]|uniref:Uncharacterized protein n=1 Tax=Streptomonospora mangrovi TaxID=2883123 RepID=A0A9X3NPQ4_9ACTN|nr:hypothetical protein [Streptomonospora mangrovi]MDA0565981.1 hypothetical protein [Streptomonospora mangrovi]
MLTVVIVAAVVVAAFAVGMALAASMGKGEGSDGPAPDRRRERPDLGALVPRARTAPDDARTPDDLSGSAAGPRVN